MIQNTIIVVDDDEDILGYLRQLLTDHGYIVHTVNDGIKALDVIEKIDPDLVLLDLGLPTLKGESVFNEIKKDYPDVPIIFLTAKDKSTDIARGLNLGADDYVVKPFDNQELLARIQARLRKTGDQSDDLVIDTLTVNTKSLSVRRGDRSIHLTPHEFKILVFLIKNKNMVLSREMILSRLWHTNPDVETRVVDVYIGYLRKKIDVKGEKPLIRSIRGFGYQISEK